MYIQIGYFQRVVVEKISGHLNQVIRVLLNDQTLEYTLPDKPNSRLQQYRLTEKGRLLLGVLRKGSPA
jgi:ATP-dependent DNA helicase RecG